MEETWSPDLYPPSLPSLSSLHSAHLTPLPKTHTATQQLVYLQGRAGIARGRSTNRNLLSLPGRHRHHSGSARVDRALLPRRQQLIQGHSTREGASPVRISLGSVINIHNKHKDDIPAPSRGRPNNISPPRRRGFRSAENTSRRAAVRSREGSSTSACPDDPVCTRKESGHTANGIGGISNRIMCSCANASRSHT